ncbi:unnamed protein product [Rotaria sordida]|uniref:Uncharacterized protein n=1 Tax=Rotaria sordida TaxID=392033 RepID=A0A814FNM1_9BILA|nr:unnamed protein product [Rotaria sordida]CAF0985437.1 unnamed protein product [Rotaria sordida]CAF1012643.1 unnamed protein product [Rotaria sordida]CAF1066423.1 unnamed protein product [Rotaria sordida]CAF1067789.1 unnamed protein product [Rotaria sordida]
MSLPSRSQYKDCGVAWVSASNGQVPPNAVPGGKEANGETLYVARFITKEGQLAPGKLSPQNKNAYSSCGGKEQSSSVYQVLTHPNQQELRWVPTSGNNLPTGALQGGGDHRSPLFIGRAPFQGSVCCGKFEPTHGCVYLPYGGQEHSVMNNFEVLCLTRICE